MTRLLLSLILLVLSTTQVFAATFSMDSFEKIPVQHEGRIKPLESFARLTLKTFSQSESLGDKQATTWLAETLFDPLASAEVPVFLVRNGNVRHLLALPERQNAMYSYAELTRGLGQTIPEATRLAASEGNFTRDERDLLQLHENALLYTQILRTFSLILPLNVDLPPKWGKKMKTPVTYLDLRKIERDVQDDTLAIIKRKGEDPLKYKDEERKTVILSYQMELLGDGAENNQLLRLIPVQWSQDGEWLSPWAVLQEGQGSPETGKLLDVWRKLAQAWQNNDTNAWNTASQEVLSTPLIATSTQVKPSLLTLEVWINKLRLFTLSFGLYALSLAFSIAFIVSRVPLWNKMACGVLLLAALLHTTGITARMVLLERPPVSTLYESLLFVSAAVAWIGLLIERFLKNATGMGILTGAAAGLIIGLLAQSFGEADTLKVLTAVLNTRFWLATHVVCITLGYGWCVAASVFAHILLARKALGKKDDSERNFTILMTLSLVALLFTAIGTILGGIWADQSWGRFWGWDPKENGALLIVLWLVWLMHAKLSGHFNQLAMLAGHALLSIVVAVAWLGVNLLGVGLHSYGFAEGLMSGLGLFALAETLLVGGLFYIARKKSYAA